MSTYKMNNNNKKLWNVLRKMGRAQHCTEEKRALIKSLIGQGKTYRFVQEALNCSAKMIRNVLEFAKKQETRG